LHQWSLAAFGARARVQGERVNAPVPPAPITDEAALPPSPPSAAAAAECVFTLQRAARQQLT